MTKLLKKSLAVVISVALCLSVMVCGFVTSAEGNPTITAKVAETAIAGENVEISIYAEGFAAAAIAGAEFTVELGDLAYVALADGAVTGIDAYTNVVDNTVKFVSENIDEQVTADGALFTITAALPAEAEDGAEFTVSIVDGIFCTAADGEPEVEVDAVDGVVTIATPVVDPSVAINVSPAEGYIGDEIAIEVVAANFDKVAGAQFVVDLAGLEYVSVASDAIEDIEEYINAVDGGVKFVNEKVADGLVDIEAAEGVLFTITAKITDVAESFEIAIVDSKFCEGGEGEPVIENVILAGATVASLGNKGPVEDAALANAFGVYLGVDATPGLMFMFSLPSTYDDFEITMVRKVIDVNNDYAYVDATPVVYNKDNTEIPGMYAYTCTGIALYELSADFNVTIEGVKDGEVVGIATKTFTMAELLVSTYNAGSGSEAQRKMYAELLWLGDASLAKYQNLQAGKGFDEMAVPSAGLNATKSSEYDAIEDTTTSTGLNWSLFLGVEASPSILYAFTGAEDTGSITATHVSGNATLGTVSDTAALADIYQYGMYMFGYSKVALFDGDKIITTTVKNADGDVIGTYSTSLEMRLYATLQQSGISAIDKELYERVIIFGKAARAVFG